MIKERLRAKHTQFDTRSKKQMLVMFTYIKQKGYEQTKAEVMRTTGHLEA